MTSEDKPLKLYSMPVQMLEIDEGVLLKRGCTEVALKGRGIGSVIKILLAATAGDGARKDELVNIFAPPHRPIVEGVIDQLLDRRLLEYRPDGLHEHCPESTTDIFYWHFDTPTREVLTRLNTTRLTILGVNWISRHLTSALVASGIENFVILDHPRLRNVSLFHEHGGLKKELWSDAVHMPGEYISDLKADAFDCLIVTSEFGRSPVVAECNRFCVQNGLRLLPVILQDVIGYVGPFVVPGETACWECTRLRQNSHLDDPDLRRAIEEAPSDQHRAVGFHPLMASIVADIAAFEVVKFYGGVLQPQAGALVEVNLLANKMTARKVLKIPRCPACSLLNTRPPITPKQNAFVLSEEISP